MTGLAVLVSGTVVVACGFLTEPGEVRPPRAERTPQFLLSQQDPGGCRKVRFTLSGSTGVEGVYPDTACGMQVELIASGSMSRSGDTVSIPFRLRNRSASAVLLPLRVEVRDSGIVDLEPLEVPTAEVVPLNMDSTLSGGRSVWLVGGAGSLAPGDSTGADTLLFQVSDSVTVVAVTFEVVGNEGFVVTLVRPDFKPAWFAHDSSYFEVRGTQKRVLTVDFSSDATVGELAAALALVGGEVVGGMRLPAPYEGGFYYIRVPGNPSVPQLDSLAAVLRAQPKVEYASRSLQGGTVQGIRPVDGTGWERSAWNFNPDFSAGDNWAYEEIAAPLAWGCSVGDGATRIAVLDMLFDRTEVDSNVVSPLPPYGRDPGLTSRHGTAAAGIIASPGGNGIGMAGVVWKGAIRLVDFGVSEVRWEDQAKAILEAGRDGFTIVNLSLGSGWGPANSADVLVAMQKSLRVLRTAGATLPLIVVPAGNENVDAWFSVWPTLRDSLPGNILVVGGSRQSTPRDRWGGTNFTEGSFAGSNHGDLIDVYAPAVNVAVPTADGTIATVTLGTSFAAPLVTGIAGLLKSFDPSLTPGEIRDLIIEGAEDGNRPMASHSTRYLVNAYASLKRAARKEGGALCGNPVWAVRDEIHVQRDSATTELLLDTGAPVSLNQLTTHHGGRSVGYWYQSGGWHAGSAVFNGTAWLSSGESPAQPPGGAVVSSWGSAHDGDAYAYSGGGGNEFTTMPIYFGADTLADEQEIATFAVPPLPAPVLLCIWSVNSVCEEEVDIVGVAASRMSQDPAPVIAFHPNGDTVLVAVPYVSIQNPTSIPGACSWAGPPHACPQAVIERRVDSTTVYRMRTSGGTATRLWSRAGHIVHLGLADGGEGENISVVHETSFVRIGFGWWFFWEPWQTATCSVEFRSGYSSTPDRTVATACGGMLGGIAPVIAGGPLRGGIR